MTSSCNIIYYILDITYRFVYHTYMDTIDILGTAFYETYGAYCDEIIAHGYNLDYYYNAATAWGNFDRVLVLVAFIRGAQSYNAYVKMFDSIRQERDNLVSKNMFFRVTGLRSSTQTQRTREYRQRLTDELDALRESTAKSWIDSHIDEAQQYITDITVVK